MFKHVPPKQNVKDLKINGEKCFQSQIIPYLEKNKQYEQGSIVKVGAAKAVDKIKDESAQGFTIFKKEAVLLYDEIRDLKPKITQDNAFLEKLNSHKKELQELQAKPEEEKEKIKIIEVKIKEMQCILKKRRIEILELKLSLEMKELHLKKLHELEQKEKAPLNPIHGNETINKQAQKTVAEQVKELDFVMAALNDFLENSDENGIMDKQEQTKLAAAAQAESLTEAKLSQEDTTKAKEKTASIGSGCNGTGSFFTQSATNKGLQSSGNPVKIKENGSKPLVDRPNKQHGASQSAQLGFAELLQSNKLFNSIKSKIEAESCDAESAIVSCQFKS